MLLAAQPRTVTQEAEVSRRREARLQNLGSERSCQVRTFALSACL